jgi:hypothetical protein
MSAAVSATAMTTTRLPFQRTQAETMSERAQAWIADTKTLQKLNRRASYRETEAMSDLGVSVLKPDGRHCCVITNIETRGWEGIRESGGEIPEYISVWTTWIVEVEDPRKPERDHAIVQIVLRLREVVALDQTTIPRELADRLVDAARDRMRDYHDKAEFIRVAEEEIERLTGGGE